MANLWALYGQLFNWWSTTIVASLMLLFATIMCNHAANLYPQHHWLHSIMQLLYDFYLMQLKVKSVGSLDKWPRSLKFCCVCRFLSHTYMHTHTEIHTDTHTLILRCNAISQALLVKRWCTGGAHFQWTSSWDSQSCLTQQKCSDTDTHTYIQHIHTLHTHSTQ